MQYYSALGEEHEGVDVEVERRVTGERGAERKDLKNVPDPGVVVRTLAKLGAKGGRFLDVGCGFGEFSAAASGVGFEVTALELSEDRRRAAAKLFNVTVVDSSFEDFESDTAFDVVLLSQILEHAFDVEAWVEKASDLVARGGMLVVALPNFGSIFRRVMQEREPYICPPAHLNFFSPGNLAQLLESHGFEVVKVQWVSRLPVTAFTKRLPAGLHWVAPGCHLAAKLVLALIDALRLGMIIRVYARKRKDVHLEAG